MREKDIRPLDLVAKYRQLSLKDAEKCFSQKNRRDIPCVACGENNKNYEFSKQNFSYASCNKCNSLFQVPRPNSDEFEEFYQRSESSKYWAEIFFPSVIEIRREKIFKPRVKSIYEIFFNKDFKIKKLIDVGAGFGLFLEEWLKLRPNCESIAIEPNHKMADECRKRGLKVIQDIAENINNLDNFADLIVSFEVLEHIDEPLKFIKNLKKMLRPGGYIFISTLSIDGFDLKTLWDSSEQISPPHHINFLSISGFKALFERAGMSDISISTPGKLDTDIVRNALENDSSLLKNQQFLRHILNDDKIAKEFQIFLSNNCLSSHAWIIAKKKLEI